MSLTAALTDHYRRQADAAADEAKRLAADPANQRVPDPYLPGHECRAWEAQVHPSVRPFRRVERSMARSAAKAAPNTEENR